MALPKGIVFVTGGARGLGNATAVSFAREGAKGVILVDRGDERTLLEGKRAVEATGAECMTIGADVTREDEVIEAIEQTVKRFGRIDYAVNFAGITGPLVPFDNTDLEDFKSGMDVNSTGVWICVKHELRQMRTQEPLGGSGTFQQRGSIVNAASVCSLMSLPSTGCYTASKHAVVGITKAAAFEARDDGIRVNCVSPGWLKTPMNQKLEFYEDGAAESELWNHVERRQGGPAEPSAIGEAVVLLSSPRMSLVNGQNISLDRGFSINAGPS